MFESVELNTFVFSMLPFFELRLGIPYAIYEGIFWQNALIFSLAGNFVPIIPLVYTLNSIIEILKKNNMMRKILDVFIEKTRRKSISVEKYGFLGLILFVSIPIPGSGIYSGAAIAYLLGINKIKTIFALILGMVLAGVWVTLATLGVISQMNNPYIIIPLILLTIYLLFKKK